MSDLFDIPTSRAMLARIAAVTPDSPRQWGKMDAAQMLAHCRIPLELALGTRTMKRGLIGLLFGGLAKRKLVGPDPFAKDAPTAPSFRVKEPRVLETERAELVKLVNRFTDGGPSALIRGPHPFFGPMTAEEWSLLQWKHLDHHLRQFGA